MICTVDAALLTLGAEGLMVALLKRDHQPYEGTHALPGGFIHPEQDLEARDAAQRVLREKIGVAAPYLEQLATFTGPARDPRGWSISIAYYALVPHQLLAETAAAGVRLVSVDRLHTLPFDHNAIVDAAVARLRNKSTYSSLPCFLLGEVFTLPQLQRVYESLIGDAINKVSFRRKMAEMDFIEAADDQEQQFAAHRPAQLYRLKPQFREKLRLLKRGL